MNFVVLLVSLLISGGMIESRTVEQRREFDESINEIGTGKIDKLFNDRETSEKQARQAPSIVSNVGDTQISNQSSVPVTFPDENNLNNSKINKTTSPGENNTSQQSTLPSFLLPFLQKFQFSPQVLFGDRFTKWKQSLGNLDFFGPLKNSTLVTGKQFSPTDGILNLLDIDNSEFYTDRLEPAGYFGGNGWFANKGGILGGPGAILSTGSLLTDYQSPYRK